MDKIRKLRELLLTLDCDAALLTSFPSRLYFSSFSGGDGYLFITKNSCYIVTDSRYTLQVHQESKSFALIEGADTNYELLKPITEKEDIKKIAFEDCEITVSSFNLLKTALPDAKFKPLGNMLREIRRTKNAVELKKIKASLALSEYALSKTLEKISAGMSETEVAAILEGYMRSEGAEKTSFDTICASGIRSALPHGMASGKIIEKGDFLTLDFGCVLDGYCSDITRTFVIGSITDYQKEIYSIVLKAQLQAEKVIVSGILAKEADATARNIINSHGYGKKFGHSLGHGVGLEIHELPNLSPRSTATLCPGDVVTVEPGIYIENFGGVRIEDMVYIGEKNAEILTKFPKELIII